MNDTGIYPYPLEIALQNGESDAYHASFQVNQECAAAIDEAIAASNYEQYRYNLSDALDAVTKEYGLDRVAWLVAGTIQAHEYDGRYSQQNKEWAREYGFPRDEARCYGFRTHPSILDGFANKVRGARLRELAQTVGLYENRHHMAERNRLTCCQPNADVFVPKPGVTERQLIERSSEIAEKLSVQAQLRAARKAEKQTCVSGPRKHEPDKSGREVR